MISSRPRVLGVGITPGRRAALLQAIRQHLQTSDSILHVVTANPEYVMTARKDSDFARSLDNAGLVTVDGAGLAAAVRLLHPGVDIERYTGVMLTPDMVQLSAETGTGVFLLGAGPGIADRASEVMLSDQPGGRIVGTWADGSPNPDDDVESMRRIRESGAGIVLVAYGAPAQIYWIVRNLPALQKAGVRVVAGIGGAFDYISGNVTLPSPLVRKLGLEWLVRLVREPWRWRRQLVLPHFAVLVLIDAVRLRLRGGVE
jgi:N-acetylglucosaminyldiphosphoundecaprenol N-acetyl-beta-D-mannosaminyltransferase